MDNIFIKTIVITIISWTKIFASILIIFLMSVLFVNNNIFKMELYALNFLIYLIVIGMERLMIVKDVILIFIFKKYHLFNVYRYHKMNWFKDVYIMILIKCVLNVMQILIMKFLVVNVSILLTITTAYNFLMIKWNRKVVRYVLLVMFHWFNLNINV